MNPGGQLSPGNSPGVLRLSGTLALLSGAVMDYELSPLTTSDEVLMPSGVVSLNDQQFSDFDFTPLAGFGLGAYTLIDAGSISGSLGEDRSGMVGGYPANLAVQGTDLVLTVVPEPGSFSLFAGFALAAAGFAAKRRRSIRDSQK